MARHLLIDWNSSSIDLEFLIAALVTGPLNVFLAVTLLTARHVHALIRMADD